MPLESSTSYDSLLQSNLILTPIIIVALSFIINYIYTRRTYVSKRNYYISAIRNELENAQRDLQEQISKEGELLALRNEVWNSLLSSGSIELLKPNELYVCILVYSLIDKYNQYLININKEIADLYKFVDPLNPFIEFINKELNKSLERASNQTERPDQEKSEILNSISAQGQIQMRKNIRLIKPRKIGSKLHDILSSLLDQLWIKGNNGKMMGTIPICMNSKEEIFVVNMINASYIDLKGSESTVAKPDPS